MDSDGHEAWKRGYGDSRFRHQQNVGVFGSYDPFKLAEDMLELARRFNVKLSPQSYRDDRWQLGDGESYGRSLSVMCSCEGCGKWLVSATANVSCRRGWYCGRCRPFSSAGNVDHAEWLAQRRGRASA